jgi:hypothetical protein
MQVIRVMSLCCRPARFVCIREAKNGKQVTPVNVLKGQANAFLCDKNSKAIVVGSARYMSVYVYDPAGSKAYGTYHPDIG